MTKKELDRAKKAVALHTLLDNIYTDIAFLLRKDSAMGDVLVSTGTVGRRLASCDDVGSRLAFRTRELAAYAGRQFTEEWADFMLKPRSEELNGKAEAAKTIIDFNNNEDE